MCQKGKDHEEITLKIQNFFIKAFSLKKGTLALIGLATSYLFTYQFDDARLYFKLALERDASFTARDHSNYAMALQGS